MNSVQIQVKIQTKDKRELCSDSDSLCSDSLCSDSEAKRQERSLGPNYVYMNSVKIQAKVLESEQSSRTEFGQKQKAYQVNVLLTLCFLLSELRSDEFHSDESERSLNGAFA